MPFFDLSAFALSMLVFTGRRDFRAYVVSKPNSHPTRLVVVGCLMMTHLCPVAFHAAVVVVRGSGVGGESSGGAGGKFWRFASIRLRQFNVSRRSAYAGGLPRLCWLCPLSMTLLLRYQ